MLTLKNWKIPCHYEVLSKKKKKKQAEIKSCVLYCPIPLKSKAADLIYTEQWQYHYPCPMGNDVMRKFLQQKLKWEGGGLWISSDITWRTVCQQHDTSFLPTIVCLAQTSASHLQRGSQRGGKNTTVRLRRQSLLPSCLFLTNQTLGGKKWWKRKKRNECERGENRERQRLTHGQLTGDTNPKIMLIFPPLSLAKCFHTTPFICGGRDVNLFSGWQWALSVWFLGN